MSQNAPNLCNTTTACTVARSPTILFRDREVIDDFTNDNDRNQFLVNAVNTQLMIGVCACVCVHAHAPLSSNKRLFIGKLLATR